MTKKDKIKKTTNRQQSTYCRARFGGTPTAPAWMTSQTGILVSQFRVRQLADRNALRNWQRQHVSTVVHPGERASAKEAML